MQEEMTGFEEIRCSLCNSPIVLVPVEGETDQWQLDCRCHPENFTLPRVVVPVGDTRSGMLFLYATRQKCGG